MNPTLQIVWSYAVWITVLAALAGPTLLTRASTPARRGLAGALFLLLAMPATFVLRGALGELSGLALALALASICKNLRPMPVQGHTTRAVDPVWKSSLNQGLALGLLGLGLLLNVSALGFLPLDLYALGYDHGNAALVFGPLLLLAWRQWPMLAWSWLLMLAAIAGGLHLSPNLWDGLLDVPALFWLGTRLWQSRRGREIAA